MWPYPRIVAHRGGGTLAPENTIAGLRAGLAYGFRAVEFDVMLSRDGIGMVIHDPHFGRTVGGQGSVADTDAIALAGMDAGSWFGGQFKGEPVPYFTQVVDYCKAQRIWMNIEIKPADGHEAATGRWVAEVTRDSFAAELAIGDPANLPQLITYNFADYEEKAVALANDPARIASMKRQLEANRLTCTLFDSPRFVRHFEAALQQVAKPPAPTPFCRSMELAKAIKAQPALALTGIEGYEGVIHGEHAISGIRDFAASLVRLAVDLQNNGSFDLPKPIVTASGSAWYDLIAESFEAQNAAGRFLSVLRPGSYVAHDHGIYKEAQCCVLDRRSDLSEGLRPALEVWAHVQSLPEPGFAVVALGKRDVAYDAGLPMPLKRYREGVVPALGDDVSECRVTAVMDQHAFMTVAPGIELTIGDIISFGTSHPCLTFDKWRVGCLVDEQFNVVEQLDIEF